jgi:aminoglycoside phosphotransferase (APT) family kinase protein
MEREFRFQSALEGTKVPHAKAISLCTDVSVTGSFFYVMECVDGLVPSDPVPEELGGVDAYHDIAIQLLKALGELASIDYQSAGLSDLGRPEGFLERQVGRWKSQLDSYQKREIPGIEAVAQWLDENTPKNSAIGIMHGDYNFHNMLFSRGKNTRLLAVLDWENATIGDPLMDLGYLMGTLNFENKNMPDRSQAVSLWADRSGIKPESLGWYVVMSKFKLACMLEGVYVRQIEDTTRETTPFLGEMVVSLIDQAIQFIPEASDW